MGKNRLNDPRFRRAEFALRMKCQQRDMLSKYEEPSPNESLQETQTRRYKINKLIESESERKLRLYWNAGITKIRRQIDKANNATPEKKFKAQELDLFDVTKYLLQSLNMEDLKREECSYHKRCYKNHVLLHGNHDESSIPLDHKDWTTKTCRDGYCCEFGYGGTQYVTGHCCKDKYRHDGGDPDRSIYGITIHDRCCGQGRAYGSCSCRSVAVDIHILKRINISTSKICKIADDATGGPMKGLLLRRTVNVIHVGNRAFIDPDPCSEAIYASRSIIDVENIGSIVDGRINLYMPPEREKFEITGEGGKPVYAHGYTKDCDYLEVIHDNVHLFGLDMKQKRDNRLTKDIMNSLEIRINGRKAATLGDSSSVLSTIVEADGGRRYYQEVSHFVESQKDEEWYWYESLSINITYGPLPPMAVCNRDPNSDFEESKRDDPYTFFSEKMRCRVDSLTFEEAALKRGGPLHDIALAELNGMDGETSK